MSNEIQKPQLKIVQGQIYTTSLALAQHFNKHHKNVLQAVTQLSSDLPGGFTELNFQPSEYKDRTGRPLPMYNLTRDGFTLLAMGFTGKEALQWKVRYIQAFNEMESELRRRNARDGFIQNVLPGFPGLSEALDRQRAVIAIRDAVTAMHFKIHNLPPLGRDYLVGQIKRGAIQGFKDQNGRWVAYLDSFNTWLKNRAA